MISLARLLYISPLLLLLTQILWYKSVDLSPKTTPLSPKNSSTLTIVELLRSAGITPLQAAVNDADFEYSFFIKSSAKTFVPVILSTQKNPLVQVEALQKILKIANIKGKDIQFIDLSSSRPYATL